MDLERFIETFQCLKGAYKTRRATFYMDKKLQDKGEWVKPEEERFGMDV